MMEFDESAEPNDSMDPMEELRNFNAKKLYKKLDLPDKEFQEWLVSLGLLHRDMVCPKCEKSGMVFKWKAGRNYPTWHCKKKVNGKRCDKEVGYFADTWFEGLHIPLKDVFQLSYYFCRQTHTREEMRFDMQREDGSIPDLHTLVDWMNYYREICGQYFVHHPIHIGGEGVIVEIDETVITKRKYNKGQLRAEQQWFFGGVERDSGRCFLVPVERRNASTLLPIIQKYILPGSIIMSDQWKAYGKINELPEIYDHYTVNHSKNFVDPESGAHTQTIEGTWSQFKSRHKEEKGTARTLFLSYINQFVWRKLFKGPDAMYHLWTQIRNIYKL